MPQSISYCGDQPVERSFWIFRHTCRGSAIAGPYVGVSWVFFAVLIFFQRVFTEVSMPVPT